MATSLRSFLLARSWRCTNAKQWVSPKSSPVHRRLQSTSSASSKQYNAKRDAFLTPTMLLLGLMPIVTFSLGTWQVERLKWKVNLIDELEQKLQREPMSLPGQVNLEAIPEFIYRKVYLKGRWDHAHTILLGPRVYDGKSGFHVITPLMRSDGSTILINRGFVTPEVAEAQNWSKDEGEVEVLGMLRTTETRNKFTPDNLPDKGIWYWVDLPAIAEHAGGSGANVQPVFIEEIFDGHAGEASIRMNSGIPIGRAATVDVRNSHVSYIATWYSLSAFTTVMFVRLLLKYRRARARLPR